MVSGFLLLRKPEPISNISRRFKRILIPFIFWLFLMCLFKYGQSDILGFVKYYLNALVNATDIDAYFWFVYLILGLYLFAPILSKWLSNSKICEVEYFLIICAIPLIVTFVKLVTGFNMAAFDYLTYFSCRVGYFVLGYYLAFKESKYLKSRKFGLLVFISGFLINYIGIIILSYINNGTNITLNLINCPGACLMAIGVWIIVKNTNFKKLSGKINEIAILLSVGSYGGYLVHMFVLKLFVKKIPLFSPAIIPTLGGVKTLLVVLLLSVIVFICTYVIIIVMAKIPLIKNFSGFKPPKS